MDHLTPELECPYVGLAPFEAVHADYFFGRKVDSAALADILLARRTTVLYGASGVGKSSVLNVGLPRALRKLGVAASCVSRRDWHEPALLTAWLEKMAVAARAAPEQPLIVVLDQFEEYFLYADAEQVTNFAKSLAALIARTELDTHLLVALRDDSLHQLDAMRLHLPRLLDTTLELRQLDEAAVREAIERPIAVWNERHIPAVAVDDNFAEALIAQLRPKDQDGQPVKGGRVELAYLQLALEKVWEAEGGAGATAVRAATLTDRLKGVGEIARRHVEEVLGRLPDADQALCATVFDRLVTPSGGKILYATTDLAALAKVESGVMDEVLSRLATGKSRILRAVEQMPGGKRMRGYEILHDILARPILDWRTVYQEAKERAEAVERAAREAANQEQEAARTRELAQAKALADAERKANMRLRWRAVTLRIAILVVLAAMCYAILQKHRAKSQMEAAQKESGTSRALATSLQIEKEQTMKRLRRQQENVTYREQITSWSLPESAFNKEVVFEAVHKKLPNDRDEFTLSPKASSIPGGLQSVASITYFFDNPRFGDSQIATGPDDFTASYLGPCLREVVALIEYKDLDKPLSVTKTRGCPANWGE